MITNKELFNIPTKLAICEQHNDDCNLCEAYVDKCIIVELLKMHMGSFITCIDCKHHVLIDNSMMCQAYTDAEDKVIYIKIDTADGCIRGEHK